MTIYVSKDLISAVKHPITGEHSHITRVSVVNDVTGMHCQFVSYGATIYSLQVRDNTRRLKEVVTGFELIEDYEHCSNPYFGATIGRVCNRLAYGSVFIYGREYRLSQNNGIDHLHGGFIGFSKIPWDVKEIHDNGVTFSHRSAHNHEGYPGEVYATVRYSLHDDNSVRIYMTATTTKPTVVNMTNHSYFNLAGHDAGRNALYEHTVSIFSRKMTVTNYKGIPTGETMRVSDTPYDLRGGAHLGYRIKQIEHIRPGFDDYYCAMRDGLDSNTLARVAKVVHPPTGLWMEVYTNQLGVQFYTGNYLPDERKGEKPLKGRFKSTYHKHGAFCLETHGYPDAPNHAHFPKIILRPGQLYEHWVEYKFGTMKSEPPLVSPSELNYIEPVPVQIVSDESDEDDVYVNVAAGAQTKAALQAAQLRAERAARQAAQLAAQQAEQPQSSGALWRQDLRETGAIKKETGAVKKGTGAVKKGAGAIKKETGAIKKETGAVKKETGAVKKETGAVKKETGAVKKETGAIKKETGAIAKITGAIRKVTLSGSDTGASARASEDQKKKAEQKSTGANARDAEDQKKKAEQKKPKERY